MSNDNMMSQDEIEKMLKESGQIDETRQAGDADLQSRLTQKERDVLGEIGNICMGTSATTLYTILDRRTNITTPEITIHTAETLADQYPLPLVIVDVEYIQGISGKNLLILEEYDVAVMTDILMGGSGEIDKDNIVLDEMSLSAVRELMNQMVGSSATSLAEILNKSIDISPPNARHITLDPKVVADLFKPAEVLVKVSFDMEIEGLLKNKIMQVYTLDFAKKLAENMLKEQETKQKTQQTSDAHTAVSKRAEGKDNGASRIKAASDLNYSSVEYPDFGEDISMDSAPRENISLLANVPMNVTVELGKAKKKIKDILSFNNGSVIVLDKLAGEHVDILVNGKYIAKGEVVVVDDSYGVRIIEINSAAIGETL